ncbi:ABC transporter substrate-binding protein [Acidisphaera sp. L21]|uniref:ABC transporter substrate-binding protein n=1 Tax=Acidisphaera sp. L21 TaxID=1641851 RepID=UPI00131CA895|nr:ABC transporter substrate-binding protein [Acidisphaera sp. L21]
MKIDRRGLGKLAFGGGVVAIAGLHAVDTRAQAAKPLVHAIPNDVASLDPVDIRNQQDQEILVNVYERLVQMKFLPQPDGTLAAHPTDVVPQLAESWVAEGPVITFKLRQGVKFYPTGNPVTAEDVRYSFERLIRIVGNGKNQAAVAGIYDAKQIEAVDPQTVRITFTDNLGTPTAIPVALTSMKFQQFAILDSVEVKKHVTADDPWANQWLIKNLATTGPYYIASRDPNTQLELKAVPNHWSGSQPAFETVILRIRGNADLVALVRGGVVDYCAEGLTGRQYDALASAGFPVLHGETPDMLRVSLAMDKAPFTDPRVRQAMMYAIPIDQIIRTALSGRGKRATGFYNPEDVTNNDSFARYALNLDKAKTLLKEAGQETFSFDFWYSSSIPYNNDIAILIQASMKRIGVTASLKPTPALQLLDAFRARINGTDQMMSGMYMAENTIWLNDPSTLTNLTVVTKSATGGVTNWARYSDLEADALHEKYRNSVDVAARVAAYQTIQNKLAESCATSNPLVVMGRTIVTSPKITGVTFSQDPYARYAYLKPKA